MAQTSLLVSQTNGNTVAKYEFKMDKVYDLGAGLKLKGLHTVFRMLGSVNTTPCYRAVSQPLGLHLQPNVQVIPSSNGSPPMFGIC